MFITVVMEQQRRPRRSFPDGYKAQVVELCRSGERSVGAVRKTSICPRRRVAAGSPRQRSTPANARV